MNTSNNDAEKVMENKWKCEKAKQRWIEINNWADKNMAEFVRGENQDLNSAWSEMRKEADYLKRTYMTSRFGLN